MTNTKATVSEAVRLFLENASLARSRNTAITYGFAMRAFTRVLAEHKIDVTTLPITKLEEGSIAWLARSPQRFAEDRKSR